MRLTRRLVVTALAASISAAFGDHEDHGRRRGKHDRDDDDEDGRGARAYFRAGDARLIAQHCQVRTLPPGLQKKLYRTGRLPPGWEKRFEAFPPVLERRLPPICSDCARGLMGGVAIVYSRKTGVILDLLVVR